MNDDQSIKTSNSALGEKDDEAIRKMQDDV